MGSDLLITPDGVVDEIRGVTIGDPGPDQGEVYIARRWLEANRKKAKYFNRKETSLQLAAAVVKTTAIRISHGALIKAAVDLGYKVDRIGESSSCYFNMRPI